MFEESTNKRRVIGDGLQLLVYPVLEFLALFQRVARHPGTLGMTPYQLIGIEVRGVAWQEMQRELAPVLATYSLTQAFLCAGKPSTTKRTGFLRRCISFFNRSTNNSPVSPPS